MENNLLKRKLSRKFSSMERGAAIRGIKFEVTLSEYTKYFESNCYYCGSKSIGLDRVDSSDNYHAKNIVPCCGTCNLMKGTLEADAFLLHCKRITQTHSNEFDNLYSGGKYIESVKSKEKQFIVDLLNKNNGNRTKTAKEIRISTTTLWGKIKHHNLASAYTNYSYELS